MSEIYKDVNGYLKSIGQRVAMNEAAAAELEHCITAAGEGVYLEIGSLYGGSAIIAGLVMRQAGYDGGVILCIEPFEPVQALEYKVTGRDYHTLEKMQANIAHFGLQDKISIIPCHSIPWPLKTFARGIYDGIRPSVTLIDGAHTYSAVVSDWINASAITERYILIDDYTEPFMQVRKAVDLVCRTDERWRVELTVGGLVVFVQAFTGSDG